MKTDWKIDGIHSYIGFRITMLGIAGVRGHFNEYAGTLTKPNEDSWEGTTVDVDLQISSIDTGNKLRDEHLAEEYFFDTAKYPTASFKGLSFVKEEKETYLLSGNLTIKGITKPIELEVEFTGFAKDREGNDKAGFSATGKINREDFGIAHHIKLPDGSIFLSKKLKLQIDAQLM
ncbi:MAG: YceI family protein [Rhizobacter sp.]|nr:YceI family protein [Ferruginibacter sp.]